MLLNVVNWYINHLALKLLFSASEMGTASSTQKKHTLYQNTDRLFSPSDHDISQLLIYNHPTFR
jgi:hypothetical protein